jgi:hypothetical protein
MTEQPSADHSADQTTQPPPVSPGQLPASGPGAPNSIRIPILISAILNVLMGIGFLSTCFLFFMAIPVGILAVFEFMLFVQLGKPDYAAAAKKTKIIQILEIASIICGNLGSMICGILGLVFASQEQTKGTWPAS